MREAIGGTLLLQIMLVFLTIFISLLAIGVNYTNAYRVKNRIVSIVEEYEGVSGTEEEIREYISGISSYSGIGNILDASEAGAEYVDSTCDTGTYGYCIICRDDSANYQICEVTTTIKFSLPFGFSFSVPVKGETELIRKN